jgi:uncharacterized surface protein with fasciclin (FAS1) repeats
MWSALSRRRSPMQYRTIPAAILACALALPATAQTVQVGGQPMFPSKTIVANAVNSSDHTTLVAAVKAAGLADTLSGRGPFTVFAPVNAAFAALPAGTVDTLLKPENKGMLTKVLTYHVVAGSYDSARLRQLIKAGHGEATLKTVAGETLTLSMNGPTNLVVRDGAGGMADITIADVRQSNGVIHVIDRVLMPAA